VKKKLNQKPVENKKIKLIKPVLEEKKDFVKILIPAV